MDSRDCFILPQREGVAGKQAAKRELGSVRQSLYRNQLDLKENKRKTRQNQWRQKPRPGKICQLPSRSRFVEYSKNVMHEVNHEYSQKRQNGDIKWF